MFNELEKIVQPLLEWYDVHARILPWRDIPTPYRVWISEIMLQQTRVEAVKPYFERFLGEQPNIYALATAREDRLLKLWEGLGYYNRVKNLQKAAKILVEQYNGELPPSYEDLLKLPGIGRYTAGVIISIAYGQAYPAVDGNVLRVVSRYLADSSNVSEQAVKNKYENAVKEIIPHNRAGAFNQAMMELGATVCLPLGMPKCTECPLQNDCEAYRQNKMTEFPVKTVKKKRRIEEKTVLVLVYEEQIAVRQRENKGLLSGLWEFPLLDGCLNKNQVQDAIQKLGFTIKKIEDWGSAKHIFTHVEWHMTGYLAYVVEQSDNFVWASKEQLKEQFAIPSAFRVYYNKII